MTAEKGLFITEPEAMTLLAPVGVPFAAHALTRSAREAARAAEELGFPVVLKVVSRAVVHKSDLGGVVVNLADGSQVEAAFERISAKIKAALPKAVIEGFLVCRQAGPGVEVIVGAMQDAVFGPVIMCGLGGVFTEILKDVAFRVAPFGRLDASEMLEELKGYPVLTGARGGPAVDLEALIRLLTDLSVFLDQRPDILELDLNPVRVYDGGLIALDARVRVIPK